MTNYINFYVPVYDSQDHISATGNVSIRFNHEQIGNPSHFFNIDFIALIDGFTTITVSDHDALSGRDNIEVNHPNGIAANTTKNFVTTANITGNFGFFDKANIDKQLIVNKNTLYVNDSPERVGIRNSAPCMTLHSESGDSGVTSSVAAGIFIENDGNVHVHMASSNDKNTIILFSDPEDEGIGKIDYDHADDSMRFDVNNSEVLTILGSGDFDFQGNDITNIGAGNFSKNITMENNGTICYNPTCSAYTYWNGSSLITKVN